MADDSYRRDDRDSNGRDRDRDRERGGDDRFDSRRDDFDRGRGGGGDRDRDRGREREERERATEAGTRVFVGGLDSRATKQDLEDFFKGSGTLVSVWVARSPPGFGFVEFKDPRDAADAVKDLDGRKILGNPVRIELANGRGRGGGGGGGGDRRPREDPKCYNCNEYGHFARDCNRGR